MVIYGLPHAGDSIGRARNQILSTHSITWRILNYPRFLQIPIPMPRFLHSSFSSNSTRPVRIARRRGDRLRSPADGPQSIMIWSEEIVRNASVVGFRLSAFSFQKNYSRH